MSNKIIGLIAVVIAVGVIAMISLKAKSPVNTNSNSDPNNNNAHNPIKKTDEAFTLQAVGGSGASGDGSWNLKNGKFSFGIKAAALASPEAGKFYQLWLSDGTTTRSFGRLTKSGDGYVIGFQTSEEIRGYNRAIISLESTDDEILEKKVLEGQINQ